MLKILAAIFFILPIYARADGINVGEQFAEGGLALIVILLMSVLMIAVAIERLVNFRTKNIFPSKLIAHIRSLWLAGDFEKIHEVLAYEKNTLGRILNYMVSNRHLDAPVVALGASEIASLELRQQQQKAYALAIVATVAPIVGLLGTVIGMIEAFHVIAYSQGMGNPALLAGGISKALINTAAGLSVALPSLAAHHFFKHRSVMFGLMLEQAINQRINEWFIAPHSVNGTPNLKMVSHAN